MGYLQKLEVPVYTPRTGDRVRLLIQYQGTWRALLWCLLDRSGNLYIRIPRQRIQEVREGRFIKRAGDTKTTIKYAEGIALTSPSDLQNPKISFHETGTTKMGRQYLQRKPLSQLTAQEQLGIIAFEHPKAFDIVSEIRPRDICWNYRISEDQPLVGSLFVAPHNKVQLVRTPGASNQVTAMLQFTESGAVGNVTLQIALYHGPQGPWPPMTYFVSWSNP